MKIKKKVKIALFLIAVLALLPAFVRAYTIDGPSMSPTFWWGDRVVSSLAAYDMRIPYTDKVLFRVSDPSRGNLILYFDIPKQHIAIKRVIGLPGDTIELKENVVYINDIAANQTTLLRDDYNDVPSENNLGELVLKETLDGDTHLLTYTPQAIKVANFKPVVVPANQYFILGDNRDNSQDSRYIGFITREQIKGQIIYGARTAD